MKAILTVQNFTSDFVTSFWTPIFVGIFIAIVAYALGLATRPLSTRRRKCRCGRIDAIMAEHNEIDHVSGKTTTGHEWDGIKELNTPLPRWWVITFYLTIVWAVGYWVVYPAWPMLWSHTTGLCILVPRRRCCRTGQSGKDTR